MSNDKNDGMNDEKLSKAMDKAKKYEKEYSEEKVEEVNEKLSAKIGFFNRGPLAKVWDNVMALWDLLKDPKAAKAQKVIAIGALLYMLSPIDVIPDVLFPVGFLDDVAVIGTAVATLATALAKYKRG